jgi:hypothetical protein
MMEAVRTSETSVDNNFTRQYIPEDNSERDGADWWNGGAVTVIVMGWYHKVSHAL